MTASRRAPRSEAGVTLIEVMVTIAIMGIAFTGLLAALAGVFQFGTQHRKLAVAETLVRRYADSVGTVTYVNCATATDYAAALTPPPPAGYSVQIIEIDYWTGDAASTFGSSCNPASEHGVQRITVRVAQTDVANGVTKGLVVMKRNPA